MQNILRVSIAPHIRDKVSSRNIVRAVILSLIPAGAAGVFIFGIKSLYIIIASVISAVVTEIVIRSLIRKKAFTYDGTAILTGLLLAYSISPQVPIWIPIIGSFFAIAIGKEAFGGFTHNIFNPALIGRAFLMASWPGYMTSWQNPHLKIDAVTSATPLMLFKHNQTDLLKGLSLWDLFLGNRGGCIGEVCIAALLIGAAYLLWKRYITWHIPISYILTVASASWIFNGRDDFFTGDILFFVLSGGLILGAFFMATDYITSPLTSKGKLIFGIGCGILTFIIRRFSGYPEGVSYAILIMNATTPIIDRYSLPKWFGWQKEAR